MVESTDRRSTSSESAAAPTAGRGADRAGLPELTDSRRNADGDNESAGRRACLADEDAELDSGSARATAPDSSALGQVNASNVSRCVVQSSQSPAESTTRPAVAAARRTRLRL